MTTHILVCGDCATQLLDGGGKPQPEVTEITMGMACQSGMHKLDRQATGAVFPSELWLASRPPAVAQSIDAIPEHLTQVQHLRAMLMGQLLASWTTEERIVDDVLATLAAEAADAILSKAAKS